MAKGNMLLGMARGSVGDVTFSRTNGQQIARARQRVVKNPKTDAQLIQRVILLTVAQAYSHMQAIVDHSFEGVTEGQKSMSYFESVNAKSLRKALSRAVEAGISLNDVFAFTRLGSNALAANAYVISKGSLPRVAPNVSSNNAEMVIGAANTYQAICDYHGLQRGDQLTFCTIETVEDEQGKLSVEFRYNRVILDPTNPDGSEASMDSAFITGTETMAINLPSPRNQGDFATLNLALSSNQYLMEFKLIPRQQWMCAAAIIVSRRDSNGNWLRSNAQFVTHETNIIAAEQDSMGECLMAAKQTSINTTNPRYLNNSGQGRLPIEGEGGSGNVFTPFEAGAGNYYAANQEEAIPYMRTAEGQESEFVLAHSGSEAGTYQLFGADGDVLGDLLSSGATLTEIGTDGVPTAQATADKFNAWFTPAASIIPASE